MKKLLIGLLALGTLSFVPAAEARCRKACAPKPRCAPCAPQCETKHSEQIVYEPCTKMIEVKGVCPHTIYTDVTTCVKESKKCTGPCSASCDNEVGKGGASDEDME